VVLPKLWLADALAQSNNPARRIFVVIQLAGGVDGLNTVVPYTNSRYRSLRPTLAFPDTELKDAQGNSTILTSDFGLHPSLSAIKSLYDAGRVAIVHGVGYPNPNLSHFLSMDIWHTANPIGGQGDGWLGKYADLNLLGQSGLSAVSVGNSLPKSLFGDKVVVPNISPAGGRNRFVNYNYITDGRHQGDRNNRLNTFRESNSRSFEPDSFIAALANTGLDALDGAQQVQDSVSRYSSTITYPIGTAGNINNLAIAMQMVAQLITTIPGANLFYVNLGGFDHHSQEIGNTRAEGQLATLLRYYSEAVKAFYDDMVEHGLVDNVLMMQWSEFGRRPNENASRGTDHGTAAPMMVIGNPVRGGLYGEHPSLETLDLDRAGNLKFTVDFRAVYATILDKWLGADSQAILGERYEDVGFLG
jgi:uncharacterized protein (DUF1501 family)